MRFSKLEELSQQSEYGAFVADILEFYVPIALKLPGLREDPKIMKETVKARSASGATDVVTVADRYVQELCKGEILRRHPDWQFWGEEGSDNTAEYDPKAKILVVLDPIEGTNNFKLRKDDQWGSVLGLVDIATRTPIAGIVAHPTQRTFYVGIKGVGVFELNYGEDGKLTAFSDMKAKPEFPEFAYNNSPHFSQELVSKVEKFFALGRVQPLPEEADEYERLRRTVHIKRGRNSLVFVDPESGALEIVRYRGTIFFKTSNEMAAVFPIIEELGGKVTDGNGQPWSLGINSLIAARSKADYLMLKRIYDGVRPGRE